MSNLAQQSNTVLRGNGQKMVQGVGVSLHYRLGYKARFSGDGLTCRARFLHLNKVKENGQHAHSEVFMVQLNKAVTELTAALFLQSKFAERAEICTKNKWANGYTQNHYDALSAFIMTHPQAAIQAAQIECDGLDIVEKDGIFG